MEPLDKATESLDGAPRTDHGADLDQLIDLAVTTEQPVVISDGGVNVGIAFSFVMPKGAWDYWANFANLPGTEGRWFPTGFEDNFRDKGWYEVNDIPLPAVLG